MKLFWVLIPCVLLAACGPRYVTDYDLFPPKTASGKQCVTQCEVQKERCEKSCYQSALRCERYDDSWGHSRYGGGWYGSGSGWGGGIGTAFPSGTRSCGTNSCTQDCRAGHLACHENCGGKVVPREPRCVSGCRVGP